MSESVKSLYEVGLERYQAGEDADTLIPVFKEICDRTPKNASAWSSLAWLYLLTNHPERALKAAQKGVKLDKNSPQARINLALALLDAGKSGVREHIDFAQRVISLSEEAQEEVNKNIQDGLTRKPDWETLKRVQQWLLG